MINLTVGTPPKQFNTCLELDSNALFLPSRTCKDWDCRGRNLYYNNRSTTHSQNGTQAVADYWDVGYFGFLSQDTVNISGLQQPSQTFEEFQSLTARTIGALEEDFDGMLGLAPPWSTKQSYPNFLSTITAPSSQLPAR